MSTERIPTDKNVTPPKAEEKKKSKKTARFSPVAVGFVDKVPDRERNDFWSREVEDLRQNPGRNKQYEAGSSTTASYLKSRYGLITSTRSRPGDDSGKVNLYVQYPGKEVNGQMVPDDDRVRELKETYGNNSKDE